MGKKVWVLGASDPEMAAVKKLLLKYGQKVVHAVKGHDLLGERWVRGGEAYGCDPVPEGTHWVECAPRGGRPDGAVVIDHHRPGDPGYGRPPKEYWEASSIGQVWRHLGLADSEPGMELRMIAAADHCLAAAYRGECPGVDPNALMEWRVETRAAYQGRTTEALMGDVGRAREALKKAPRVLIGGGDPVADLRGQEIPELPEAAVREGIAFLATPKPEPGGRRKVVLQAASSEQIKAFLEIWAPLQGLKDLYGDPERGFAGGYWGD